MVRVLSCFQIEDQRRESENAKSRGGEDSALQTGCDTIVQNFFRRTRGVTKIIGQIIQKPLNAGGRFQGSEFAPLARSESKIRRPCDDRPCAIRRELQSDGMAGFESASRDSLRRLPTRRPLVVRRDVGSSVEAQSGNDRVGVTIACVNGDPFTAATLAVLAKFSRADRRFQQPGAAKCVGDRSGTIVTTIGERFMSAAKNVRLAKKLVGCPDRAFHGKRRGRRSSGLPGAKSGLASRHSGARRGKCKGVRVDGRDDCGQKNRTNNDFRTQGKHGRIFERVLCHKKARCQEKNDILTTFSGACCDTCCGTAYGL